MEDNSYLQTTLNLIPLGKSCIVYDLKTTSAIRRRFLDIGIIKGTLITALNKSPSGDPIAYLIRGAVIAIRSQDSRSILVTSL